MSNTNREVLNDVSASNTTALHMLKPSQVGLILDSTSSDVSASTFDVIIIGGEQKIIYSSRALLSLFTF